MKENEQFAFIWAAPAALIAPNSALVGFRPTWIERGYLCGIYPCESLPVGRPTGGPPYRPNFL
jgi:hypothetical protein